MMDPDTCYRCKKDAKEKILVQDKVWWGCPHIHADPEILVMGRSKTIHVYDLPPPECQHKLEHAVAEVLLTEEEPIKKKRRKNHVL